MNIRPILIAALMILLGFILGYYFHSYQSAHQKDVNNQELNAVINVHDFHRSRSRSVYVKSDTVLNAIWRLVEKDSTILSKGRVSKDPLKRLLMDSHDCLSETQQVLRNYEYVYTTDSTFFQRRFGVTN